MTSTATNALLSGGIHNFRDLGGIPLQGELETQAGRVFRSCALQDLDEAGQASLRSLRLALVVDLRSDAEIAAAPGSLTICARRVHVPIFASLTPIAEMFSGDASLDLGARYIHALETAPAAFACAMTALAQAEGGPVAFHCTAGKDRTGLIAALLLDLAGASPAAIADDYARTTHFAAALLEKLRSKALARGTDDSVVARVLSANAPAMLRVMTHVSDRYNGSHAYLRAAGVEEDDLEKLANLLR
jgi:protein-tyrosine phosphatase